MTYPEILFEDNHVIVVIKPAGVLSQADITGEMDMLTWIKAYLKEKYNKPGDVYLGLLHRLDRPVSGIMVFAKTSKCASRISAQIREGKMEKFYRAVVCGKALPGDTTLRGFLLKNEKDNTVTVYLPGDKASIPEKAKESSLTYRRIGSGVMLTKNEDSEVSLLEIDLHTGRSHQIRAQLAKAGLPILGDQKYGRPVSGYAGDICLEAFRLIFSHPISGEKMEFVKTLPDKKPWSYFFE